MKNRKLVIFAVLLALLLLVAALAYHGLAASVAPAPLPEEPESASAAADAPLAPDFTVMDGEGNPLRLSDLRGRPVVINFWATWCPPCRAELPYFDAAWAARGEEIAFMMIDLTDGARETEADVAAFLEETGYRFPVCYDTELEAAMAYGVSSIPLTVLVDAEGHVLDKHLGSLSEEALNSLLDKLASS